MILYGLLAVVTGIGDLVFYVKMEQHMGFGPSVSLIAGLLSVMAGFMLLVHPDAGKWIIALLVPIWFIAHCISRLMGVYLLLLGIDCLITAFSDIGGGW